MQQSRIYVFMDAQINKPYVGQSVDVRGRLKRHIKKLKISTASITAVLSVEVAGGVADKLEDVIEALEQHLIEDYNGPGGKTGQNGNSANKRHEIDRANKARARLVKLVDKIDICR